MNLKRKMRKGFTLVELVVVIAVIAVLAAVSVGAYFGVTDSANSSAADQTNKQVRDLWVMYSVGEYKDTSSVYDNAADFCLRYFEENGQGDVDINFKTGDESKGEILLKIETAYPTYIYIEDKRIVEYSEICKSEEAFVEAVSSSELVADSFKNDQPFEIETIDYNGEKVRGFSYYNINVYSEENGDNPSIMAIKKGEPVVAGDNRELAAMLAPGEFSAPRTEGEVEARNKHHYVYNYENKVKGDEFDTTANIVLDSNDEYDVKKYEQANYSYITNEVNIYYEESSNNQEINISNYPVAFYEVLYRKSGSKYKYVSSQGSFYKSFDDYFNINNILEENGSYNVAFQSYNQYKFGYIMLGNTEIKNNINFSNYNLILDIGNSHSNFVKFFSLSHIKQGYHIIDNSRMAPSENNILCNTIEKNSISHVTVREGTVVNLSNCALSVEAFVNVPLGNNSVKPGYATTQSSHLTNNGTINLSENSVFRTIGLTDGSGVINGFSGSKIYEPLKLISEQGTGETNLTTNATTNKFFATPIYEMDSNKCKTIVYNGASYNGLVDLHVTPFGASYYLHTVVEVIGNTSSSNCLFKILDGSITKSWNNTSYNSIFRIDENSVVSDCYFSVSVEYDYFFGKIEMTFDNTSFNFSISNFDIVISKGASFNLTTENTKYEFNPLSSLIIENGGILNVNSGKLAILNFSSEQYDEMIEKAKGSAASVAIFNYYKNNQLENLFINNGTVNISAGSGIYFANSITDYGNIVDNNVDGSLPSSYTYQYLTGPTTVNTDFAIPYVKFEKKASDN